jgi:REP element-mobilizing transposase RayT
MYLDTRLLHRRSTRLRARDYSSPGNYFVTLCTHERRHLFGEIVDGVMHPNDLGEAAELFWNEIPRHFPQVELDEHIVMPNHAHGIIRIVNHEWVPAKPTVRAIGIPGLLVAGTNGVIVGANDHSPLHAPNPSRVLPANRDRPRGTSRTIGSMIRGFKIGVTRAAGMRMDIDTVWQRNYHDHIIRNDRTLERVRAYIRNNPANWDRDRHNPERHPR